jgi:hypothetical protein
MAGDRGEDAGCAHRGRPAGVEGEVRDHLGEFVVGESVVDGTAKVSVQLGVASEGDESGDGDQAPVARWWAPSSLPTTATTATLP